MEKIKKLNLNILPFYLGVFLLTAISAHHFFFWDTIQLGAKHALFFYETNFSELFLPDEFDSGHIPAFGMYLALYWKIFGKSLAVSHWVMVPFLIGIVYQAHKVLQYFISKQYLYWALLILLIDSTLLAQSILVSPDIPLVFFFLMGLNAILSKKPWFLMLAALGLSLISMRGMMVAFALGVIDVLLVFDLKRFGKSMLMGIKKIVPFIPAILLVVVFNIIHFKQKGWFAYHEDSPWADSFVVVDAKGILYNFGLLAWRFLDFGRVVLVLLTLVLLGANWKRLFNDRKMKNLVLLFIVVLATLSVSFVLYSHLSGHRYLLPAFLAFAMLGVYLLFETVKRSRLKSVLTIVLVIGLLSGNLWVYPPKIAQGWDASLAHWPYYKLRKEVLNFLEAENISIEEVGCTFPNDSEFKYMDLNDANTKHSYLDLQHNSYVLYSNVYNDFPDDAVDQLEQESHFSLVKEFKKGGVFLRLYKKR